VGVAARAKTDLRVRLAGNEGAVEGGEGEAREVVRLGAATIDPEDDLHLGPSASPTRAIADAEEPPEAQSDEALAEIDRVILAITVERVSAVTHM
jgi:hypothetical protein